MSRRSELAAREKGVGSGSQSVAHAAQEDQRVTHSLAAPGGACSSEGPRDPPCQDDLPKRPVEHKPPPPRHLHDGSDRPDSDSLKRRSSSKARSTPPASTPRAPWGEYTSAPPRRLQSLITRGGGAPAVEVPLSAGRSQVPASNATVVGRLAPEQPRDQITAHESSAKDERAPMPAESWEPASKLAWAKRSAPE